MTLLCMQITEFNERLETIYSATITIRFCGCYRRIGRAILQVQWGDQNAPQPLECLQPHLYGIVV